MRQTGPEASLAGKGLWAMRIEGPMAGGDVPGSEVVEVAAGPAAAVAFDGVEASFRESLAGADVDIESLIAASEDNCGVAVKCVATAVDSMATDEGRDPAAAAVAGSKLCISTALLLTWPPCVVWRGSLAWPGPDDAIGGRGSR
jgi:hypothetical protein